MQEQSLLNQRVDVLDHGFVRLVDYMGGDISIVRAARVSYAAAWRAGENENSDEKLINYLWKHKHTTPFEAVTLTLEVQAPIFVFRQWHRHRTQSYNELSARYRELPDLFYVPKLENVGVQSKDNKQGRSDLTDADWLKRRECELEWYDAHCKNAFILYQRLLKEDWPKELARGVLPFATYSHMFTTMNLLNLFRFLDLRADSHAQYEIRAFAEAIVQLVTPVAPVAVGAWAANREK